MVDPARPGASLAVVAGALATAVRPVRAHVSYVTDPVNATAAAVSFVQGVLSTPLNLAMVVGGTLGTVAALTAHLVVRPTIPDVEVLREVLDGYRRFVPWMLRLSLGLPLVGAGFAGYLFSPSVPVEARVFQVALGFLLLCGLATRLLALAGLVTYLGTLAVFPDLLLAIEYVPGFVALILVGSGRPSADHMIVEVGAADETFYGRIDPIHRVADWFSRLLAPYRRYLPTVLRVGLGVGFVYLGVTQKLANPGRALQVVTKYDLTSVVPVDPGLWVVGAGLVEFGVGTLLVVGYLTRASAAVAFMMLVMTLFGLPDDPVLAHITLFGMLSAVFTLGAGPLSLDDWLSDRTQLDDRDIAWTDAEGTSTD